MVDVPTAPVVNGLSNITSSSMFYGFSKPIDNGGAAITDYDIQYATNINFTSPKTYAAFPPGDTYRNLSRVTQYFFRSRARNSKGYGPWSVTSIASTIGDPPSTPDPFYLDAQGQTGMHFLFHGSGDNGGGTIREYQVSWSTGGDANNGAMLSTQTGSGNNGDVWIYGLSRYTYYNVWVRARNDYGWSGWSSPMGVRTHAYVPASPVPLYFDSITQTSLHFAFKAGDDNGGAGIQEYQFGYSTDPNSIQNITSSGTDVYPGGLAPYTTYYFWARSRNEEGWSNWSSRASVRTLAGAKIRLSDGSWVAAIPYVKESGTWKLARPYVKRVGLWKTTE